MTEDEKIIRKFENRDESGLSDVTERYGAYLKKIAQNILGNREDAEEALDDSFLQVWNAIPPEKPQNLAGYLVTLTRRNAIDIYRKKYAEKRRAFTEASPISEIAEIAAEDGVDETISIRELERTISDFLRKESRDARVVFVLRYYYMDSIADIRKETGFSAGKIKSLLFRTRNKLRIFLQEEGYIL